MVGQGSERCAEGFAEGLTSFLTPFLAAEVKAASRPSSQYFFAKSLCGLNPCIMRFSKAGESGESVFDARRGEGP